MKEIIPYYVIRKRISGKFYYVRQPRFLNVKDACDFGETLECKYVVTRKYFQP